MIEALPLEIQRNFTLIRELDSEAQASMRSAEASAISFIDESKEMTAQVRMEKIKYLTDTFARCVQQAEDKVSLAVQTYDMVHNLLFGITRMSILIFDLSKKKFKKIGG